MNEETIAKISSELRDKYPDMGLLNIEINEDKGTSTFYIKPKKELAFLNPEKAAVVRRDVLDRTVLDLAKKDAYTEEPLESFKRATRYYFVDPLVGSVTNLLANLARKGFENDIDDANIKAFFDVWAFDVEFDKVLEWIFLEFFRAGHVTTYKTIAKYEPRVSYLSPVPGQKIKAPKKTTGDREKGAKKNIWSKGHLPIAYTVLNPLLVTVDGSLLFDKYKISLNPPPELTEMLKKPSSELTPEEKEIIKNLPSDLKSAAESGKAVSLDYRLVGSITYRKQPYERYAKPRIARIFDSIEYKDALRQADLSTLDGISNYILKVTIGSDEYPVTRQEELEAVGQLFNTPSKAFDCVWNHTLQIEKIVSPEISSILGQDKYKQVNEDITGGLAVSRAMIDGTSDVNAAEISLMIKGLMEEINYARRQVTRWIYAEYRQIAEAMKFERFPKIRWDNSVLQDVILYMSTLSSLVDRRMLSYQTALEELGFDYSNEQRQMEEEFPLVMKGLLGIIGSPFQQAKAGPGVQPTQKAPTGTPSDGRPKGKVPKKKEKEIEPSKKLKTVTKPPKKKVESGLTVANAVKTMSDGEFGKFLSELTKLRSGEEIAE